jgi:uncharacterized protein
MMNDELNSAFIIHTSYFPLMVIDIHVHISAITPGRGRMSPRLLKSAAFRFMRWHFGLDGADASTEAALEKVLADTIEQTEKLDAAAVLAFDAVYDTDGRMDEENTHLYVTNDYVMELAKRNKQMLFACSVHPYRKDALVELERCIAGGAVLMKWLPITQNINTADDCCIPLYECMAHHNLPLLCHTGWEHATPILNKSAADPSIVEPALKRGVKVIAAHCGSRLMPWETDFVPTFLRLANQYEHLYGDTAALNVPNRWYAFQAVLQDKVAREKLLHGSDWPIIPIAPPTRVGLGEAIGLMREKNWMRRDVLIKEKLGFDEAYWQRAGKILRMGK